MSTEVVRSEAELEVARALLELHNPRVFSKSIGTHRSTPDVHVEVPPAKHTAFGPMSVRGPRTFQFTVTAGDSKRMGAPNLPTKPKKKPVAPPKWKINIYKKYQQEQRRWRAECFKRKQVQKRTRDFAVQTTHEKFYQCLVRKEKVLTAQIASLSDQIEQLSKSKTSPEVLNKSNAEPCSTKRTVPEAKVDFAHPTPSTSKSSISTRSRRAKTSSCLCSITPPSPLPKNKENKKCKEKPISEEEENGADEEEEHTPSPAKRKSSQSSINVRKTNVQTEMVSIGDGHAKVPSRLLKQLDWSSYTSATRKLLSAVFSRKVLATHSLSGKPSPAFPNKPAKERLDPDIVNDIVITVRKHCNKVSETHIRAIVTTKCADESKMYRSRQRNKQKRRQSKKENVDSTSEDSS